MNLRYQFNHKYQKISKILNLFGRCDTFSLDVTLKVGELEMLPKDFDYFKNNYRSIHKGYMKDILAEYSADAKALEHFEKIYSDIMEEYAEFERDYYFAHPDEECSAFYAWWENEKTINSSRKYDISKPEYYVMYERACFPSVIEAFLPEIKVNKDWNIAVLEKPENAILKKNLLRYEWDFSTGMIILLAHFELNEETKRWLLKYRLDSDLFRSGLENLALYKKGQIKYASISHERMNSIDTRHIKARYLH